MQRRDLAGMKEPESLREPLTWLLPPDRGEASPDDRMMREDQFLGEGKHE